MNPQLPLADIHELESVAGWPPAIGWWLVTLLLAAAMIVFLRWLVNRYRHKQLLRDSLAALKQIETEQQQLTALNGLLKRHLKSLSVSHPALALSGNAWANYLVTTIPENDRAKVESLCYALAESLYQPEASQPAIEKQHIEATRYWLKQSWSQISKEAKHAAV